MLRDAKVMLALLVTLLATAGCGSSGTGAIYTTTSDDPVVNAFTKHSTPVVVAITHTSADPESCYLHFAAWERGWVAGRVTSPQPGEWTEHAIFSPTAGEKDLIARLRGLLLDASSRGAIGEAIPLHAPHWTISVAVDGGYREIGLSESSFASSDVIADVLSHIATLTHPRNRTRTADVRADAGRYIVTTR